MRRITGDSVGRLSSRTMAGMISMPIMFATFKLLSGCSAKK
ncbi:MAG: hypothetical protein ACO3S3_06880 [Pseudohongiellaceae bacterium]